MHILSRSRDAGLARASRQMWRSERGRLHLAIHVFLLLLSVAFILPFLLLLSGSFSSEDSISTYGYTLLPHEFSLTAYQYLLADPGQILQSYLVSIEVTLAGSVASLVIVALLGYVLSRREFPWRRQLSFFVLFTMLFNGGLVPIYLVMTQLLHLQNTLLAYIVPYLVIPLHVLLLRTYFAGLPIEISEAARLDGAGEWRIFWQINVPMAAPALATVGLFSMLIYWNDWLQGLLYISDPSQMSLQYLLYQISSNIEMLSRMSTTSDTAATLILPTQSVLMAMAILAIGPIVLAFGFTQRYFIRGVTLGGIKGD